MQWESMGFEDDPFRTHPITAFTLDLYTGNTEKINAAQFALQSNNMVAVIEGSRGVGTTSFANFLRFNAQKDKKYFTPTSEIRVEPNWNADTLMAAVIANVVSTLELSHAESVKDHSKFQAAKSMVQRVSETYRSFGASAFGFGANFGKSNSVTQPVVMPTQVLSQCLEGLVDVVMRLGFKYGMLVQLNNLDVGVVQEETHLKNLLNVMRDYFQMPGTSWLLVGDLSLRRFIAQNVDRVDDIVAYDTDVTPLSEADYLAMIEKRVDYYRVNANVTLPVDQDVWLYLYRLTKGRLRYIFGLLTRLFNTLQLGTLIDRVTLELAKPVVVRYAQDRIARFNLSANEELVLKAIVHNENLQVGELADLLDKKNNYVSSILSSLQDYRLVNYNKRWRSHYYYPSIDAVVAYSEI